MKSEWIIQLQTVSAFSGFMISSNPKKPLELVYCGKYIRHKICIVILHGNLTKHLKSMDRDYKKM